MASTTFQSIDTTLTPQDTTLRRLTVEAAKFHGVPSGDTISISEIQKQGEANGFTDSEVRGLLESDSPLGVTEVRVPQQGDLFGELWATDNSRGVPNPDSPPTTSSDTLTIFREWCEERAEKEVSHSYTRKCANRRFARAKDVDRHFIKEYDTFSTVLITYDAGEPVDESVAEYSKKFYPRAVVRKRRRILKKLDVYDDYAGVTLLAPKKGDRVPYPDAPLGYSHAHTFLWIPGEVSTEDFHPLVELHVKHVDGATIRDHPLDRAVQVQVHDSTEVGTPTMVLKRGSVLDRERGSTTALPQELGANLPLLQCKFDARGTPDYVEEWCAHLRLGTNRSISTSGISRFRQLGRFGECADSMKWTRKLRFGAGRGLALLNSISKEEA